MDAVPAKPRNAARLFAKRRVLATLLASLLWSLPLSFPWQSSYGSLLFRCALVGLTLMVVFGILERWPRQLPRWIARWVLQVVGVAFTVPFIVMFIYVVTTDPGAPPFYHDEDRMGGYSLLTGTGILLAPWVAMSALLRQRDRVMLSQAVAFERDEASRGLSRGCMGSNSRPGPRSATWSRR